MDALHLAHRLLTAVPANRTAGVEILHALDGTARVTLTATDSLTTPTGSLHAAGLVALLDATGLAAVLSCCPTETQANTLAPVATSVTVDFRGPGLGPLVAECVLDDEARVGLQELLSGRTGRARLRTTAEITNCTGDVVCSGTFRWSVLAAAGR